MASGIELDTVSWRDSARSPKIFGLDARASYGFVTMIYISWTTFFIGASIVLFFAVLQYFGFTVPVFARWVRSFLAGPYRPARGWWSY